MSRIVTIFALVVAGEMVFALPFHITRFFRPTMLEVFGYSNTNLGDVFALYGVGAMLAYFPGGAIADRFSARGLITTSLLLTAVGGFYFATIPGQVQMGLLYIYWGVTTIFLFWGALIRATREWGGEESQGVAFGWLEGGRGVAATVFAFVGVAVLASYLPEQVALASDEDRLDGFRMVVYMYTAITIGTAALTWFAIPVEKMPNPVHVNPVAGMLTVIREPILWALAAVIVCAYCGYKGLDNYSLYAVQVLGMNEVDGARLTAWASWTRPFAPLIAGIIADRFDATRSIGVVFAFLALSYVFLALAVPDGAWLSIIYANFFVSTAGVYALRGIYFALIEENNTPRHITGAAVGLMSVVGYTPEIFFPVISGRILDATPGIGGFQNYFWFLSGITATGVCVILVILWMYRTNRGTFESTRSEIPAQAEV